MHFIYVSFDEDVMMDIHFCGSLLLQGTEMIKNVFFRACLLKREKCLLKWQMLGELFLECTEMNTVCLLI